MPSNLLLSLALILLCGFWAGRISRQLGAPPLLGMMLIGIVLRALGNNIITANMLDLADSLRSIAVSIILMRAGLGLDPQKLLQQGSVALRLGFLPALTEAIAIAIISLWLLDFNWLTGLLLGCVISAESPAVIVPGMLYLKNLGWGVNKGITDAILTGSALSDVLILLLFSLLLNFIAQGQINNYQLWLLPITVIAQIILGILVGYLIAQIIFYCTAKYKWTDNSVQDTVITTSFAWLIVVTASYFPYFSGYLAVMAIGFFLIRLSPALARRLRQEFNHLWIVAEIILFVLMGANIQLKILVNMLLPGLLLLILGLLLGRTVGWYLATLGSNWTWKEKLFLLPGNSAKATVQAAIGAIPLSMGISGGETILAIAALSILVTAPIGAWAIPTFAPKLLTQDPVDPIHTSSVQPTRLLGILEGESANAIILLAKIANLARRTNGKAIIMCSDHRKESNIVELKSLTTKLLLDIPHKFIETSGYTEQAILSIIEQYQITEIFLLQPEIEAEAEAKNSSDSLAKVILDNTNIPLVFISTTKLSSANNK